MSNPWQKKAAQAKKETDAAFSAQIKQLSSINEQELDVLLEENEMDKTEFNQLIQLIKDQTKTNQDKINAISNVKNGLELIVGLVGKLI